MLAGGRVQQAKQIAHIAKALQTATVGNSTATAAADPLQGTKQGGARSWATVAAGLSVPPPAARTVRTWTSATGEIHREYLTPTSEREITIKLHDSTRGDDKDGKAVKSWLQGSMANHPKALINHHINWAIHQGATSPEASVDTPMADSIPVAPKPYSGIEVDSAVFLKSGDIQVYTTFVAQAKALIEYADQWVKFVGSKAKVVVPTFGVVIHGLPTSTFSQNQLPEKAQQLKALNAGLIQDSTITYMGWLTKEGATKPISSLVVEFSHPGPANKLILSGCVWSNETHPVERYDKACRIKQCLRCQKYGHITTQCAAARDICGFCSDPHNTRKYPVRTVRGPPKCSNCRHQHPAWNPKCDYRKRERQRVQDALKNKTTYWPQALVHAPPATETPGTTTTTPTTQGPPAPPALEGPPKNPLASSTTPAPTPVAAPVAAPATAPTPTTTLEPVTATATLEPATTTATLERPPRETPAQSLASLLQQAQDRATREQLARDTANTANSPPQQPPPAPHRPPKPPNPLRKPRQHLLPRQHLPEQSSNRSRSTTPGSLLRRG
ncbi:hypothetical protein PG999_013280 [Apiospora kogelbergensis]|uniref:CCHC-type domain-containing protein n=1 Tax=Apiospora kogelbergensis TaxID=1337665 RepID=A0AAW0QK89_9PEZI